MRPVGIRALASAASNVTGETNIAHGRRPVRRLGGESPVRAQQPPPPTLQGCIALETLAIVPRSKTCLPNSLIRAVSGLAFTANEHNSASRLCIEIPFLTRLSETGSMTGWGVGSSVHSSPTIQSSRTAETVVDRKEAVSAGILSPVFNVPGLCRQ
jgi:hypothetical protein